MIEDDHHDFAIVLTKAQVQPSASVSGYTGAMVCIVDLQIDTLLAEI